MDRRYKFSWDLLGDIDLGRPNLGREIKLEVYRLMQFTLRDVLEEEVGTEKSDQIFYEAGRKAGKAFYDHMLQGCTDVKDFVKRLQEALKELKIGILRVESVTAGADKLVLTVDEDVDCSGLPELDFEICVYDEGFISGILESFTGSEYAVKEVDCWCTGERTCRFSAEKMN
jgi:predicted hydrocarbon binding protein